MFDYLNPEFADIDIETIAHSLSLNCRFNGHTKYFYSVAQHSLNVMSAVKNELKNPLTTLIALFHDVVEAFISDIPSPLKSLTYLSIDGEIVPYSVYENTVLIDIIYNLFQSQGVTFSDKNIIGLKLEEIKSYDISVRMTERDLLFSGERTWTKEIPQISLAHPPIKRYCAGYIETTFINEGYQLLETLKNGDYN